MALLPYLKKESERLYWYIQSLEQEIAVLGTNINQSDYRLYQRYIDHIPGEYRAEKSGYLIMQREWEKKDADFCYAFVSQIVLYWQITQDKPLYEVDTSNNDRNLRNIKIAGVCITEHYPEKSCAYVMADNTVGELIFVDNNTKEMLETKLCNRICVVENKVIEELFMTTNHHYLMFFTNTGRVYRMKAYEIPEAGRTARGTAIINLLQLNPGEKISAMIPFKDYDENNNLFMVTKKGIIKKTSVMEYGNIRKNGLIAINLKEDDELIEVKITNKESEIFLVTKQGMCIRFKETDARNTGRMSMGVIGMNLNDGDEIIGMQLNTQGDSLLIVSEHGLGKRTYIDEFTIQKRGGKGVKCYKITEKTGEVIGVKAVNDDHEIMMITTEGIIIQLRMEDISTLGRITSGVKMMNVDKDVKVARIAKVREKVSDGTTEYEDIDAAVENMDDSQDA